MIKKQITIPSILGKKNSGNKIAALTAYDFCFAQILEETDVDIVLVGDSLGMVTLGYESTLPVTMDEMIHHIRAVKRGLHHPLLVGDMPFMSYQVSNESAVKNAGRIIQEGGAGAVKLEGAGPMTERVRAVAQAGISVMGHLGLTPQSIHQFGGYKVQGKNYLDARQIKKDAFDLQKAGAFALVLEAIPQELAREITKELQIPTIGIGAGPHCDGQILVLNDMLGLNREFTPKFVKRFAELGDMAKSAVNQYIQEVREGSFPDQDHSYDMPQKPLRQAGNEKPGS